MKLSRAQRNHIASIDSRATLAQASAEGLVLRSERQTWRDNALERMAELFEAGDWEGSRRVARKFEEA